MRLCTHVEAVVQALAEHIHAANDELLPRTQLNLDQIGGLAKSDYRLIARVLRARRDGVDLGAQSPTPRRSPRVRMVNGLDEISVRDGVTLLLFDASFEADFAELLTRCHNHPGLFIEREFDVPGRNAVVRDGVVKAWRLPSGTAVVSKRDNRRKPGRLLDEQRNLSAVLSRLGQSHNVRLDLSSGNSTALATIALPLAVIGDEATGFRYAIWKKAAGDSLEELLVDNEVARERREEHLRHYRRCLDALFDNGIVWRDMSPRNVLVDRSHSGRVFYHLVDFEKVEVRPGPLDLAARTAACRTQFCVEEFGVICEPAEVLSTFEGLFSPRHWDIDSAAPLAFEPRAELAAIFAGRGVGRIDTGAFNRLDAAVYAIRQPRVNPFDGRLVRPGYLGFRVEHYLSLSADIDCADYDRKITEVLLSAHAKGRMIEVFECLSALVDRLEAALMVAEFEAILRDGDSRLLVYPESDARALCHAIDIRLDEAMSPAVLPAPQTYAERRADF